MWRTWKTHETHFENKNKIHQPNIEKKTKNNKIKGGLEDSSKDSRFLLSPAAFLLEALDVSKLFPSQDLSLLHGRELVQAQLTKIMEDPSDPSGSTSQVLYKRFPTIIKNKNGCDNGPKLQDLSSVPATWVMKLWQLWMYIMLRTI